MKTKIKIYLAIAKEAILRSPVEVSLSVIFFMISLYWIKVKDVLSGQDGVSYDDIPYYSELTNVLCYFFVCLAISYSLNILFRKSRRIFYYLSVLSPFILIYIFIVFLPKFEITTESYLITNICSLLFIYASRNFTNNRDFSSNAIKVTMNLITSGILYSITLSVLISVIFSFCHIFDLSDPETSIEIILFFCLFILTTLFFLTLEHKNDGNELKLGRSMDILLNYILTPAIVIYGVILYLYFSKVIILWTLPEGVISTTAIIFISGGIFVSVCRTVLKKRILDWVFNYFAYISIPAVILSWVSAIYRIAEYGLTGNRVYLLITLVTLTMWSIATLSKRYGRFQYLTMFAIIAYMAFTYIPGVSYSDFDRRAEDRDPSTVYLDNIRLYHNIVDIDIEEYKTMTRIGHNDYEIDNDTLIIFNSDKQISCYDILDYIYKEKGIDYRTADIDILEDENHIPLIYKNDDIMLVFDSIMYERTNGDIEMNLYSRIYIFSK